jgi:hypothetical protein
MDRLLLLVGLVVLPFFVGCIPVPVGSEYPPVLVDRSTLDSMIGENKESILASLGRPNASFASDTSSYLIYGAHGGEYQALLMVWVPVAGQKSPEGKLFCVLLEFDDEKIFRRYKINRHSKVWSEIDNVSDCAFSFFTQEELGTLAAKDADVEVLLTKALREKARQQNRDAQWQLFQMQPTEENLVWLCRAADQGQVSARNELGELYFYGSGHYRKLKNVHIPSDLSRSCMWFDLADYAQIIAQPKTSNILLVSGSYKSAEVERTARAMTAHELIEAEHLILTWEPGQCDRDISTYLNVPYAERSGMAELCAAADKGSFSARAKLGQIYYLGSKGVEPDLPRAYMWYYLAAKVYVPPGLDERLIQTRCNAMTPEQRYIAIKLLEEWKPGECEQDLLEYRE